eukprot:SAG22_NODE_15673_length_343_cov_1.270492_1_plen_93_part_10
MIVRSTPLCTVTTPRSARDRQYDELEQPPVGLLTTDRKAYPGAYEVKWQKQVAAKHDASRQRFAKLKADEAKRKMRLREEQAARLSERAALES